MRRLFSLQKSLRPVILQRQSVTYLLQCPRLDVVVHWAITPVRVQVCWYTPSGSVSDSSELTIGCFSSSTWCSAWPTMFTVTSGCSTSEKVLLVPERRLLAKWETDVDDYRLNTDCLLTCELQWHSESTAVMSHAEQHGGVI